MSEPLRRAPVGGHLQRPPAPLLRDSNALATAVVRRDSTWRRCSTASCSASSSCCTGCCTSPASRWGGAAPSTCWLEKWRTEAIDAGTRALDQLRKGVQEAITALGTGFLRHPATAALREDLDAGPVQRALLRLVYRLLVLLRRRGPRRAAPPGRRPSRPERYATYFSSRPAASGALRRRGTTHSDL